MAACSGTTASNELPADRGLRRDRRHALGGPGREERFHRLVLPALLRFAQRVRRRSWTTGTAAGFSLAPVAEAAVKQIYLPEHQRAGHPLLYATRAWPRSPTSCPSAARREAPRRRVRARLSGSPRPFAAPVRFRMECRPAFDYARRQPRSGVLSDGNSGASSLSPAAVRAEGSRRLDRDGDAAVAEFVLAKRRGSDVCHPRIAILRHGKALMEEPLDAQPCSPRPCASGGLGRASRYHGRWREMVTALGAGAEDC